jgi:hypothetical protein
MSPLQARTNPRAPNDLAHRAPHAEARALEGAGRRPSPTLATKRRGNLQWRREGGAVGLCTAAGGDALQRLEIDREGCSYTTYTNSLISAALGSA